MEGRPVFWVDTPGEFPDEPIMGQFLAYGDTLVRASYNDIHSLNHAYLFKGHQLIEAKPYGTWYLERHPSPKIALYRQVSPKEYELWKNRKFSDLGSDWGYGTKVVHFSTDRSFTTAAAPPEFPTIGVQIPTRVLLEWAKNKSIWSGILEPDQLISEFVLPANRVKELFDTQQLTFLPKP